MKRSAPSKTVVIVPTYNEKENLPNVHQRIFESFRKCDLLVIDDNSPDGTGAIADQISRRDKRVKVIHRAGKLGLGSAYVHGMKYALEKGYDNVIAMDADLSHDPRNLPLMIKLIRDHDLVIGSRYVKDGGMVNWGVGRFFISRLANLYCRWMLGLEPQDCSGGFKCYRAELLRKIGPERIFSTGYAFQVEILFRALRQKASYVEIPIIFVNRHQGESKLSWKELWQFATTVLRLRWRAWTGKL